MSGATVMLIPHSTMNYNGTSSNRRHNISFRNCTYLRLMFRSIKNRNQLHDRLQYRTTHLHSTARFVEANTDFLRTSNVCSIYLCYRDLWKL